MWGSRSLGESVRSRRISWARTEFEPLRMRGYSWGRRRETGMGRGLLTGRVVWQVVR